MKDLVQNLKVIILSTIVVLGINVIYGAWTDPTANPTGGNTEAPINVSSVSQTKQGGLNVSGPLWADGGLYSQYNTYLAGSLRINNGSQGTGKVLTSDGSGFATWQNAPGGGGVTTVYDYGTSQSGGTVRPVTVAYGGGIWLAGNQGAAINGLPFSSTGSFTCIVTPTTWNGGGGGPYGGGPDQGTGLIGCYKYSGSSVWLGNTDDQGRTVNWFAIGY